MREYYAYVSCHVYSFADAACCRFLMPCRCRYTLLLMLIFAGAFRHVFFAATMLLDCRYGHFLLLLPMRNATCLRRLPSPRDSASRTYSHVTPAVIPRPRHVCFSASHADVSPCCHAALRCYATLLLLVSMLADLPFAVTRRAVIQPRCLYATSLC